MNVILGPGSELHDGVHSTLTDAPPAGVRYLRGACTHHFLHWTRPAARFDPFVHPSASESTEYHLPRAAADVVHSSRLPVIGHWPWVVDMDSIFATLAFGKPYALGATDVVSEGKFDAWRVRVREAMMLRHYADPMCAGVLFRTEHQRRAAIQYLSQAEHLASADVERFTSKTRVVRPALAPTTAAAPKYRGIAILYAGRTLADKGGAVALKVFERLVGRYPGKAALIFVGEAPAAAEGGRQITCLPFLRREQYLELLGKCHVLFSPTQGESFGMVLLEAASRGLAIVTTRGRGMEHLDELLGAHQREFLVDNSLHEEAKVRRFVDVLSRLIDRPDRAREVGACNREGFIPSGPFSPQTRDATLLPLYDEALRQGPKENSSAGRRSPPTHGVVGLIAASRTEATLERGFAERLAGASRRIFLRPPGLRMAEPATDV